jgi:hypothetical protein
MEVKNAGIYIMRNGDECEVYGFDGLGTDTLFAEGYDLKGRYLKHWDPETGKLASSWAKNTPNAEQFDIVDKPEEKNKQGGANNE